MASEREQHLAGGGRVGDAGPAELGDALDRRGALDEVTVTASWPPETESVAVSPTRVDEPLELGAGELAEVEPVDDRVAELYEADPQSVAAVRRLVE